MVHSAPTVAVFCIIDAMNMKRTPRTDNDLIFSAAIVKLGLNFCVEVPEAIVRELLKAANKRATPVQVRATLNGHPFDANVVRYNGAWRLYLNGAVRAKAGVGVGDTIQISLEYDPTDRMPPMPDKLQQALASDERLKAAWRLQPGARRKEILAYLQSRDSAAAEDRAVRRVLQHLDHKTMPQFMKEIVADQG